MGFKTTRDFSFNSNFNFKLYGIFRFKKGYIKAFRHVLTPNVGFTYKPDFSKPFWGAYGSYPYTFWLGEELITERTVVETGYLQFILNYGNTRRKISKTTLTLFVCYFGYKHYFSIVSVRKLQFSYVS